MKPRIIQPGNGRVEAAGMTVRVPAELTQQIVAVVNAMLEQIIPQVVAKVLALAAEQTAAMMDDRGLTDFENGNVAPAEIAKRLAVGDVDNDPLPGLEYIPEEHAGGLALEDRPEPGA